MIDYYQTKREEEKRKKKIRMMSILIFVFILVLCAVVFGSMRLSFFVLRDVTVVAQGKDPFDVSQAKEDAQKIIDTHQSFLLGGHSIFSVAYASKQIARELLQKNSSWASVDVHINYFSRTVSITITPYEKWGMWCNNAQSCAWFNQSCFAFAQAPATQGGLIRTVFVTQEKDIPIGTTIINESSCANLIAIFDFLQTVDIDDKRVWFDPSLGNIKSSSDGFPEFIFSLRTNPSFATLVVQDQLRARYRSISYIDLRVLNRVYYREK